jgi:hypothetical protein
VPATIIEDNRDAWIGDHCIAARHVPGVLLANRPIQLDDPQLADLTRDHPQPIRSSAA